MSAKKDSKKSNKISSKKLAIYVVLILVFGATIPYNLMKQKDTQQNADQQPVQNQQQPAETQ